MAINNSGPVSLGGSTVGQSVAVELGLSPTSTISLNDALVRALAGVVSGMIDMNDFYGKSSFPKFVYFGTQVAFNTGAVGIFGNKVVVTGELKSIGSSTTNIGTTQLSGSGVLHILVYDFSGNLIWRRQIDNAVDETLLGLSPMASLLLVGDELLVGRGPATASGANSRGAIARFNINNGTLISNIYYGIGNNETYTRSLQVFPGSTNIYMVGRTWQYTFTYSIPGLSSAQFSSNFIVTNSSGSILVQRRFGTNGQNAGQNAAHAIYPEASHNNFYVAGMSAYPFTDGYFAGVPAIAKYNSSGVLQWRKRLSNFYGSPSSQWNGGSSFSLYVDSSNNIYCSTIGYQANIPAIYFIKFDSSLNVVASRKILTTGLAVAPGNAAKIIPYGDKIIFISGGLFIEYSQSLVLQRALYVKTNDGFGDVSSMSNYINMENNTGSYGGFLLRLAGRRFAATQHGLRAYSVVPLTVSLPKNLYDAGSASWSWTAESNWTATLQTVAISDQATEAISLVDHAIEDYATAFGVNSLTESITTSGYGLSFSTAS